MKQILRHSLVLFIAGFICYFFHLPAAGSGTTPDRHFRIQWFGQFSGPQDFKTGTSFANRVVSLLFGRPDNRLLRPFAVTATSPAEIWLLDQGRRKVGRVNTRRADVQFYLPSGISALPSPVGICAGKNGEIFFTDSRLNKIFRQRPGWGEPRIFMDRLLPDQPTGIACSPLTGEIWVAETGAHRLLRIHPPTGEIRRIGKRGTAPGEFNYPTFLWIDAAGRIYVVDALNFRVQILDRDGNFDSEFGNAGDATGYFARPKGIATDSFGHIYVVNGLFNTVQIFNREGEFLDNFGETGSGPGELRMPAGIFIDDRDRIYVADSYNSRIQIFQLTMEEADD